MSDPDKPSASELRIRREVRAMAWPLAAAVSLTVGFAASTSAWAWIGYVIFAAACLARWQHDRPRLPGDSSSFIEAVREVPWMFALVAASAITLSIGATTAVLSPEQWWPWPLLAVGVLTTAALIALVVIGRRNYERAKEAA